MNLKYEADDLRDDQLKFIFRGGSQYAIKLADAIDAMRAERNALKADARLLDWIECAAMNGQIQIALSILRTGYEIAVLELDKPMSVTVERGTLRQALTSRAAKKELTP